jgi:hypothetical protein
MLNECLAMQDTEEPDKAGRLRALLQAPENGTTLDLVHNIVTLCLNY